MCANVWLDKKSFVTKEKQTSFVEKKLQTLTKILSNRDEYYMMKIHFFLQMEAINICLN